MGKMRCEVTKPPVQARLTVSHFIKIISKEDEKYDRVGSLPIWGQQVDKGEYPHIFSPLPGHFHD
jgi:hypothetical protein